MKTKILLTLTAMMLLPAASTNAAMMKNSEQPALGAILQYPDNTMFAQNVSSGETAGLSSLAKNELENFEFKDESCPVPELPVNPTQDQFQIFSDEPFKAMLDCIRGSRALSH